MYPQIQFSSRSHQGQSSGPAVGLEGAAAAARQPGPVCNASVSPQHCEAGFQVCRLPPTAASRAHSGQQEGCVTTVGPSQGCISAG